jgi:hypothetical protein
MSIEQKIAQILAESRANESQEEVIEEGNEATKNASGKEPSHIAGMKSDGVTTVEGENPDNEQNNVGNQKVGGKSKTTNPANKDAAAGEPSHIAGMKSDGVTHVAGDNPDNARNVSSMKEDIDALMNGEELSEEFKQKATTIYEAAVMNRVKTEVSRIEEEFDTKLQEATEQVKEGLVEQVNGYLDYVVEQWIAQNEIALEHGMKSEILEGFVSGLKGLFEEHYIDIPEEKFDVLGSLEEQVEQLEAKLNEQVATNVEMKKTLGEMKRAEIVAEAAAGLTDTEVEKLQGLAEELSFEDADSFKNKVQTIRENYFVTKAQADVKSVVTDTPVDTLVEEKKLNPTMNAYLTMLDRK